MLVTFLRGATIASILLPTAALGEPIKLKLAYFTSDQNRTYTIAIKPFVDAVNADEQGGLLIEPYAGGARGKDPGQQAQLAQLTSDPLRTTISPMQVEVDQAEAAFRIVRNQWADASPRHRALLNAVEAEIAEFRAAH